jgi:hypothetical protein
MACAIVNAVVSCLASTFAYASWPFYAPLGQAAFVNGTCLEGYVATDPSRPPQRLCTGTGTYATNLINECIRTCT